MSRPPLSAPIILTSCLAARLGCGELVASIVDPTTLEIVDAGPGVDDMRADLFAAE